MSPDFVINLGKETLYMALIVVSPVMLVAFVVGLTVSLFQAVTQIQEMTLALIPKLLAMGLVLIFFGSWMLQHLMNYTQSMFGNFNQYIH